MPHERLQLPLPFPHQPGYAALDFVPDDSNRDALAWLSRSAGWPDRRLAVWGQGGCGKSHLLNVWAEQSAAALLVGQTLRGLDSVPETGALVLDDADTVADERVLLHLLNTARDRGLVLLLSGRTPPARWPVRLPDLRSRLKAITAVEIQPPGDALLRALLMRMAADRQLIMGEAVQEWLLRRLPRSPSALREAVARLDRASMACQQPITRSFAARVLDMAEIAVADADEFFISSEPPSPRLAGFL
nr:chromosomal replication initiator DnaA [uncultured Rhodopila sp.]